MTSVLRLRRQADFRRASQRGRKARCGAVVARVVRRGDPGPVRVGVRVPRSGAGAVARNRVRRRLRAIVAGVSLAPGHDVVLEGGPEAATKEFRDLIDDVEEALRRAGLKPVRR